MHAGIFKVPGEPWVPALAMALNFFLIAQARPPSLRISARCVHGAFRLTGPGGLGGGTMQLSWTALSLTAAYTAAAAALWLGYGASHSVGGRGGWGFAPVDEDAANDFTGGGERASGACQWDSEALSLSPVHGAVLVARPPGLDDESSLTSLLGAVDNLADT